jgi:hypothetical protein
MLILSVFFCHGKELRGLRRPGRRRRLRLAFGVIVAMVIS